MAANKINNKIEIIKNPLQKVINIDNKMEIPCQKLPIFYQWPVYCYIDNIEMEFEKSSKPCILCNNFCSMCLTSENIARPKLTRQTNHNILCFDNNFQKEYTMIEYLKSKKEIFAKKDNK